MIVFERSTAGDVTARVSVLAGWLAVSFVAASVQAQVRTVD